MIYRSAFISETIRNAAAIALVFGGLLALVAATRLLGDHAGLPAAATLALVGLESVKTLPQLFTAALFAAVVIVLGRMRSSGEMIAWSIAGLGVRHWLAVVVAVAIPVSAAVGYLALKGAPWSVRYAKSYLDEVTSSIKIEEGPPSLFGEVDAQGMVYHLDRRSPDGDEAFGIFIHRTTGTDTMQIIRASSANTESDAAGLASMRFEGGYLHELDFGAEAASRISFAEAELLLGSEGSAGQVRRRGWPLEDLGGSAAERTEYWWRYSFIPAALLFAALAVPLSAVDGGRNYLATLALLSYWLYYAVAGLAKDMGIRGDLDPLAAGFAPLALPLLPLLAYLLHLRRARLHWRAL